MIQWTRSFYNIKNWALPPNTTKLKLETTNSSYLITFSNNFNYSCIRQVLMSMFIGGTRDNNGERENLQQNENNSNLFILTTPDWPSSRWGQEDPPGKKKNKVSPFFTTIDNWRYWWRHWKDNAHVITESEGKIFIIIY